MTAVTCRMASGRQAIDERLRQIAGDDLDDPDAQNEKAALLVPERRAAAHTRASARPRETPPRRRPPPPPARAARVSPG